MEARFRNQILRSASRRTGEEVLVRGDLKLVVAYQKALLVSGGEERDLGLTPIEFKLLYSFVRSEGRVVSRSQLLTAVWGNNVHVIDRIIDRHVCSLRQKLSPKSHYVETVPREGYRFVQEEQDEQSERAE